MNTSKTVVWIISVIIGILVVLLAFRAGMTIGYRQAEYSFNWQHAFYARAGLEATSSRGLLQDMNDNSGFLNDHGAIGTITTIGNVTASGSTISIHDLHENVDKTILVSSTTSIITPSTSVNSSNVLRTGQNVAVTGVPNNQGEIIAEVIRLLP